MKLLPLVICGAFAHIAGAQSLEVVPTRATIDEMVAVRAAGLTPNERVTLQAELTDGGGQQWASHADFKADTQGNIDTSKQAPVAGSYKKISAIGLIWSMMPQKKGVSGYLSPPNFGPQTVDFHLLRQGKVAAAARLEQRALADGVERTPVYEDGLRGTWFVPAGAGRHAAVLVLGGSNGGVPLRQAAWLASHGYFALALAYFHFEDLPKELERIPLEYFQKALEWMVDRPEIGDAKIAVLGTSRGGELALQLGSMFPRINAVVAYVPANTLGPSCCGQIATPAWTWQGRTLSDTRGPADGGTIEVESTKGPILMISGQADQVWDSSGMADAVVSRLKHRHFAYSAQNLKYSNAGHLAGRQEFVPTWHGLIRHPISGREYYLGGSAEGDAKSSIDSIPKVLDFLRKNLAAPQ